MAARAKNRKIFKRLLLNQQMDFEMIIQEDDPLPKLLKLFGFIEKMAARAKNRKTFKRLLLNQWMDFKIIVQECFLGDPLPKLLKVWQTVLFRWTKCIQKPVFMLHFVVNSIIFWLQSVPQDQKSVTFLHSLISLNQLLQNSKNTAYIFLTFRNHVKIFLSQNILQDILNVVYPTTLSIRTDRTDKQWRHWSDCSLRSSLIRVFTVCHSICFIYTMILQGKPTVQF